MSKRRKKKADADLEQIEEEGIAAALGEPAPAKSDRTEKD